MDDNPESEEEEEIDYTIVIIILAAYFIGMLMGGSIAYFAFMAGMNVS